MLLLRAEGVASSFIEGIRRPLVDVAAAEVGATDDRTARYISDNLTAVIDALHGAGRPLTLDTLNRWHRLLMATGSELEPAMIGAFRDAQSWIGGTSPLDAAFVPPPPEHVVPLMEDLVAFANAEDLDPVTQAAVAHAQFESIHPYGGANGRIGRILIGWILARRLGADLTPPVSVFIARDPGGYLAGLTLFRMGQLDVWVEWVAAALQHASQAASALQTRSEELYRDWLVRLSKTREDAASRKVIDLLGEHPVISSEMIAARLGISERSSRSALKTLSELRIVRPYERSRDRPGRPRQFWVANELIDVASEWPGT
jgi:Fic family protein